MPFSARPDRERPRRRLRWSRPTNRQAVTSAIILSGSSPIEGILRSGYPEHLSRACRDALDRFIHAMLALTEVKPFSSTSYM